MTFSSIGCPAAVHRQSSKRAVGKIKDAIICPLDCPAARISSRRVVE
jgi:hypothetical protein